MEPTRRMLLKGAFAAAAATMTGWSPGCAADGPARHLILVTAFGGWDTTWSFDPKPSVPGIDVGPGDAASFAGIPLWTDPSRPVARRFFDQFADRCAVVNGVSVRSISHVECMRRMLTGTSAHHAPDLGAIAGIELGADRPIPYLVLGDIAYPGTLESTTGRAGPSNQLATLVEPAPGWRPTDGDEAAIRRFTEARIARERAVRGSQGENQARIDAFVAGLDQRDLLLQRAGDLGAPELRMGMASQRALAIRALETGLSSAVSLSAGVTFDSHTDNDAQGRFHETLFGNLEALLTDLDDRPGVDGGRTMLDETLVMVTTEMGRTPMLNAELGKDHWPWASALLFGAGVRGGRVYGATDDTFQGVPVDLETGDPSPAGTILENGHVAAGVLACLGIDPGRWLDDAPLAGLRA
ncbi:MAG: DUF1501 domain-containing protein [Myxococcota bacterium]